MAQELTIDQLRALVAYDPETGFFVWVRSRPHCRPGAVAGSFDKDGYWVIRIFDRMYRGHVLAWALMTDQWVPEIDHKDMDRGNNRFRNLRPCTRRQNIANSELRSTNTSGAKGVYWCKQRRKWRARIRDGRSQIHLGLFDTAGAAGAAYARAAREMYGEFARVTGD